MFTMMCNLILLLLYTDVLCGVLGRTRLRAAIQPVALDGCISYSIMVTLVYGGIAMSCIFVRLAAWYSHFVESPFNTISTLYCDHIVLPWLFGLLIVNFLIIFYNSQNLKAQTIDKLYGFATFVQRYLQKNPFLRSIDENNRWPRSRLILGRYIRRKLVNSQPIISLSSPQYLTFGGRILSLLFL